jgi:hypothetical protein
VCVPHLTPFVVQKRSKTRKIPKWIKYYFPRDCAEIAAWYFGMSDSDPARTAVDQLWSGPNPLYATADMTSKITAIRSASTQRRPVAKKAPLRNAAYERAAKKRRAAAAALHDQEALESLGQPGSLGSINLEWVVDRENKDFPFSAHLTGSKAVAEAILNTKNNLRKISLRIAKQFCGLGDTKELEDPEDLVTCAMIEVIRKGLTSALTQLVHKDDDTLWTLKITGLCLVPRNASEVEVSCENELVYPASEGGASGTTK